MPPFSAFRERPLRAAAALAVLAALCCAVLAAPAAAKPGAIRDEGQTTTQPMSAFAGSAACAPCHERQYGPWSTSLKAGFVRYAKDLDRLPGTWDKAPFPARDVLLVVGTKSMVAYVDASWTVQPYEYRLGKGTWKERPNWAGSDYRRRCAPCHVTGANPWAGEFKEPGVGCEACHGPGAAHAASGDPAAITVPGRADGRDAVQTCRRCHNQRNNHARAIQDFRGPFHK